MQVPLNAASLQLVVSGADGWCSVFVNSRPRGEIMSNMSARIARGDIELEKQEATTVCPRPQDFVCRLIAYLRTTKQKAMRDIALDRAAKFTAAS